MLVWCQQLRERSIQDNTTWYVRSVATCVPVWIVLGLVSYVWGSTLTMSVIDYVTFDKALNSAD